MNVKCYMIQQCITMAILETLLHVLKNNAVQNAWLVSTPYSIEKFTFTFWYPSMLINDQPIMLLKFKLCRAIRENESASYCSIYHTYIDPRYQPRSVSSLYKVAQSRTKSSAVQLCQLHFCSDSITRQGLRLCLS